MRKITQWVTTLCVALLSLQEAQAQALAPALTAKFLFGAQLNGAQEVPSVTTNALGAAYFMLNHTRDTLCIEMTANGLSGPITMAHIHQGQIGVAGPIIVNLTPFISGNTIKATIVGSTVLTTQFIANLFSDSLYINVHTAANPNGEIRGQILPEEDKGIRTWLNGGNEVPKVTTNATALASFILGLDTSLSFQIVATGLSGPITSAHLHWGRVGQTGNIAQDLTSFISGNVISGRVDTILNYLQALLIDSLYVNIHTTANPNGEVRGQLTLQPYLHFDAKMDTAQETQPVTGANGVGLGIARINYTFDTLYYDVLVSGLSGPITLAHIHHAPAGVAGPIIVDFPASSITADSIVGSDTLVTDSLLRFMLEGNTYFNVHTTANPNGEVRGQIYRTFREGFTYHINGSQEVPVVSSPASGTGLLSIDRDQTNAHFMMAVNNLTGFTMAHFHNNVPGQNGPIILALTSLYLNGGVFGFWTDSTTPPFDSSIANKFNADSMYVNFHTTANPNGEIRGNITRVLCNPIPNSVKNIGKVEVVGKLYPNPANDIVTLDLIISNNMNPTIQLTDIMGRTIWTTDTKQTPGINRTNIPVSNLTGGIYFVRVLTPDGQLSYKFTKQ